MADALISPAVGGTMWMASAGLMAWCARKVKSAGDDRLVPMMGVMGAFVFTAQMINFSIPVTGSSGHLSGGLMLAILLRPHAAFLVMASVLTVQALFFADGGLLALGCNIFNLGFFPAFIAYPLIYRRIARGTFRGVRSWGAALVAAIAGLQMGAFGVVMETKLSGISELPFLTFVLLMQPIHLAIGVVEGLATAVVVGFIARARPEALVMRSPDAVAPGNLRPVFVGLLVTAVIFGGALSWFASTHPDGLEWSIAKITGQEAVAGSADPVHAKLARVQEKTAFLPDYGFKADESKPETGGISAVGRGEPWPSVRAGTSLSGIVGGILTLALAGLIGYGLKARRVAA